MKIHRVVLCVKPAVHHPRFWEIQFGYLVVWLFAKDLVSAARSAVDVAKAMPFEVLGEDADVKEDFEERQPALAACYELAKREGLAWFLVACVPGSDEGNFPFGDEAEK